MFRNVLVGIDYETHGRDALALALKLSNADSRITLAHVHPGFSVATNALEGHMEYAQETRGLLAAVAQESGLDAYTRWLGAASVGTGLRTIANAIDADLLVVGTTNRSRLTRTLLGNPTKQALTEAECAVAVAPDGYAENVREIRQVGVAYDGSDVSEAAIDLARRLAKLTDAEVSAFHVVPVDGGLSPVRHKFERDILALNRARDRISAHDDIKPQLAIGDPVLRLGDFGRTTDILIASSRGAGTLTRLMHPSTTSALTEALTCPLLVLTKGARERATAHV